MKPRRRMLITGVSGLLGNNLARYFRASFEVLGQYHAHPVVIDGVRTAAADLANEDETARLVREARPDVVIHCASLADVEFCEAHPDLTERINVLGTRRLAEGLPEGTRLVYISSDAVYDGSKGNYRESDPVRPLNVYGASKLRGEEEAARAPGALILRTNLFGWNIQDKQGLAEWVLDQLRRGQRFRGFADARFSTIYTFLLARVIERAVAQGLAGVYNCGGHGSLSKYAFALRIAERFGLDGGLVTPMSIDDFGFKARRGKDLSLAVEKLERDLGRSLPTIDDAIDAFHAHDQEGLPRAIKRHNARTAAWSRLLSYGRQSLDEEDVAAVVEVLGSTHLTQGPKVAQFEKAVAARTGARFAVAVSSGTAALHVACLAAGVGPGDEVITSPNTFVASANCAAYCGARPVFADIDPRTFNVLAGEVEKKITERTRAVLPVHFAGQSCDMEAIREVVRAAEKRFGRRIRIIEDASHALGSRYRGRPVGSCDHSDMATTSFHPVKHITTGEGGMVLTNDPALAKRLARFRSHGVTSDPSEFLHEDLAFGARDGGAAREPHPWYYEQQDLGYNYRLTDVQCALGLAQLGKLDAFRARRREIVDRYNAAFQGLAHLQAPCEDAPGETNFHLYVSLFDFDAMGLSRARFMAELRARGVLTQVHYIPVPWQPFYRKTFGTRPGDCPNAEAYYRRCLSLPLFPGMSDDDVVRVIHHVTELARRTDGH